MDHWIYEMCPPENFALAIVCYWTRLSPSHIKLYIPSCDKCCCNKKIYVIDFACQFFYVDFAHQCVVKLSFKRNVSYILRKDQYSTGGRWELPGPEPLLYIHKGILALLKMRLDDNA